MPVNASIIKSQAAAAQSISGQFIRWPKVASFGQFIRWPKVADLTYKPARLIAFEGSKSISKSIQRISSH